MVVDKNKNQKLIDLDKGQRYVKGGQMNGWKHKLKAGGGVDEHKLKYSLNNVYMSTIELKGVDFKRASVVIYNSKNRFNK
jgi:hypothetical protein